MRNIFFILAEALLLHGFISAQTLDQVHTGIMTTKDTSDVQNNCAQSFTVGLTGTLVQVDLDISSVSCNAFNVKIVSGNNPLTGLLLDSVVIVDTPSTNISRTLFPVPLSNPFPVTVGQQYIIILQAWCGGQIFWYNSNGDTYPGGQSFVNGAPRTPDLYFETWVQTATGINFSNISNPLLDIYPNPSSGIFTVRFARGNKFEIKINNVIGQQVFVQTNSDTGEIDLTNEADGIYFINAFTSDGEEFHKKVIIRH